MRDELSFHDDLILSNNQLVVPVSMRKAVLADMHKGHLGISKCHERARVQFIGLDMMVRFLTW